MIPLQIVKQLDELTDQCRHSLKEQGCILDKEDPGYSTESAALAICEWMRKEGFGPPDGKYRESVQLHSLQFPI